MTEPSEGKYPENSSKLFNDLMDTSVSCQGLTITIVCGSYVTRDNLLDLLTGTAPDAPTLPSV